MPIRGRAPPSLRSGPFDQTCVLSRTLYPSWHGQEAALQGGREDRPRCARVVSGRDPEALLERSDPRGAPRERGATGAIADHARVRRGHGDDGAPADGDRAFRQLERGEARGGSRTPTLRDA